jgi:branched-chain amino acid transport system ATP-binding protein
MLKVRGLGAGYGRLAVLHDVDFDVPEGKVVAFLGSNGAGKTTLMRTIMGQLRAQAGTIEFVGENIVGRRPHEIVRRGLTLVPQGRDLFPQMTVGENLEVAGLTIGDLEQARKGREEQFTIFPPLRARASQRAQTLSGGEQQMLAIARALMLRPRLILLDEPTMGLAPLVVKELGRTVSLLSERGNTIVLVEQNLGLALAVAQHVYILQGGRVVFSGSPAELESKQDVVKYYLG